MGQAEVSGRYFSRSIAKWFLSGFELVKRHISRLKETEKEILRIELPNSETKRINFNIRSSLLVIGVVN